MNDIATMRNRMLQLSDEKARELFGLIVVLCSLEAGESWTPARRGFMHRMARMLGISPTTEEPKHEPVVWCSCEECHPEFYRE